MICSLKDISFPLFILIDWLWLFRLSHLDLIQIMNTVLQFLRSIYLSSITNTSNWSSIRLLVIGDCIMATKFILLRRLSRFVKPYSTHRSSCVLLEPLRPIGFSDNKSSPASLTTAPRNFCSTPRNPSDDSQVPAAIDYQYVSWFFLSMFFLNFFIW